MASSNQSGDQASNPASAQTPAKARVVLARSRRPRLEQGHPWIYANEIERTEGEPVPGDLVEIHNHKGQYLATGYWNPSSQITVRIVSYQPLQAMDEDWFRDKFRQCAAYRERFVGAERSCRVVFGEADFLPGLVVDRFEDVLVVQVLTLGMDVARDSWLPALVDTFKPKGVYERSDVGVRTLEGLEERTGVLYGDCPRHIVIEENGLKVEVDIEGGQKTGYFFDQRENRAAIAPVVKGWGARSGIKLEERETEDGVKLVPVNSKGNEVTFPYWDGATVLECFAHTGSFTLHACKYGAKKVTCLDVSAHAIETAKRNAELNGFTDRVEFVTADAFEYLRQQVSGKEERAARSEGKTDTSKKLSGEARTWDVVILDPPAFAKTKRAVPGAIRGYKEINLQAMKLINEGGYLVTASCSYHVRPDLFMETLLDAAADAGKTLRCIEWRGAGKDHPQLGGVEEGHYLKFGIFEVRSRKQL
ncbi:class I SAM-dependent rRNA methyltransferase [Cohnella thailandensis]|uniref:Class I SAM-dependent rRNA methyltransferase n=1 Tax=Cohnella thailandensis TaxID=557557 RepID=A0A841T019_9BACL|nr:class I SAM-dependent rRNA methyltransferase [Cohnella thailandensis]MBB6636216.1 class I SAM-dependent rRNA methyltransferase [Cohnella thailandensis]MBP1973815.1 23S rRNA (cytosine1962-C5)-methyltransferase [Cohnella thailandensis]